MTLQHISGHLVAKPFDGEPIDLVHGVGASGEYLGAVPSAQAVSVAHCAPPKMGEWRWSGVQWVTYTRPDALAVGVEQERDARIEAGVDWNGLRWYADRNFQQQLAAYLQAYTEGILPANATCGIRAMDKQVHQLTRDELRQLSAAVLAFVQGVYAWSWAEKAKFKE